MQSGGKTVTLSRRIHFSSGHFYRQPAWSDSKNAEVFGACFDPFGHGHNYVLEAFFEGEIDPKTALVMNLTEVDQHLKNVIGPLDHKHLNHEIGHFKTVIPTTENVALYLWEKTSAEFAGLPLRLKCVKLFENEDLWSEVNA